MIIVTSVIFLLPFGMIIYNVKNQYCLGPNPEHESLFVNEYVEYDVTMNNFKNYVDIQTKGYDNCPVIQKIFKIYDTQGEPSFCNERIPNFYRWI